MTTRVLVIGGGATPEHDVSLATAAAVSAALTQTGAAVQSVTIGRDGIWHDPDGPLGVTPADSLSGALTRLAGVDVVFGAVHGAPGEDGALAALCTLAGVAWVGSGLTASAIGMDKAATKLVAESVGVATAPGCLLHARDLDRVEAAALLGEGEVVIKPVSAGSSYGVQLATTPAEVEAALRVAARYDERILVERRILGREIDVAVLREADGSAWAAPALEIHAEGLFDTASKYDGTAVFTVPARLTAAEEAALTGAALAVFDALDCAGVARMDFFLTDAGPVLNEVNTVPGMTEKSQVPHMFAAAGLSYPQLIRRLVDAATTTPTDRPTP